MKLNARSSNIVARPRPQPHKGRLRGDRARGVRRGGLHTCEIAPTVVPTARFLGAGCGVQEAKSLRREPCDSFLTVVHRVRRQALGVGGKYDEQRKLAPHSQERQRWWRRLLTAAIARILIESCLANG